MLFHFLEKGNERIAVPEKESDVWQLLGWEVEWIEDYPGAVLTANGWEVPTDGGYVSALTAYKAGLSTHLKKTDLLNEERMLTDDELFEAFGGSDTNPE